MTLIEAAHVPSCPTQVIGLKIESSVKVTLIYLWGKADFDDQQAYRACTVRFKAQRFPDGHAKAGRLMPPSQARDEEIAEATGVPLATVRKHLTRLRAAKLAYAQDRYVELVPPGGQRSQNDLAARLVDLEAQIMASSASAVEIHEQRATLAEIARWLMYTETFSPLAEAEALDLTRPPRAG